MAQVGGLGPFKFENVLPAQAGGMKKKSRPAAGIGRGAGEDHTFGIRCQVPLKEVLKDKAQAQAQTRGTWDKG